VNPTVLTLLVGIVGASIPVIIGQVAVRRRTGAETTDLITQAAGRLVERYEARIAQLEAEVKATKFAEAECKAALAALRAEVEVLRQQIKEQG